ncbi:SusC/RagA family TonB-linked outer membrane protein [uncultured Pedobacter sp.]|uniref:SusC/RagA family TonB-linked outer membrane protein n=1 Tax=uncultured Pedobacter sp. TaxID=246139 RepID=UPI0025E0646C|nr:SusC/RagA family TonB-linked outer membrane protein [uncultured Pedobacter sp.]
MKQIKIISALCLAVAFLLPAAGSAQTTRQSNKSNKSVNKNEERLPQDTVFVMPQVDSVQVAFRKVAKRDLLGDVSAINLSQMLEKNYTTSSLEGLDALLPGFNGNIWGMGSYLVLVDGIPRDINNIMPTEIDQITILKGVNAVALYGSRAAKGVLYITTKRGGNYEQRVNVRANTGLNVPKGYPQFLGSAEYMTLYNEARRNDGLPDLYTQQTIYNYASGTNPYRYPNVDYYSSDYLRNSYGRNDVTAEISGGNNRTRYYTNLGYWSMGSLLNFGEAVKNSGANRFNVRGNIDVKLNKIISLNVDATASFYTGKGVNTDYWGSAATVRPYRFAPLIPISMIEPGDVASLAQANNSNNIINGSYLLGGSQLDQTNSFASIYAGGYNRNVSRQFQFNTGINFDLSSLMQGLSFKTMLAVDYSSAFNQSYNNTYSVYEAAWNNYAGIDQISSLTKYGIDARSGIQNVSGSAYRQTISFSGQFNYARTFKQKHNVTGSLLGYGFNISESSVYHATNNANLGLQLGYNYDHRYYADFSGAYVYSAKLPTANRGAFSPTLSLGWRLSEEAFLKNSEIVDQLKVTASAGILNTDLDINNYNLYQGYFTYNDAAWYSWRDGGLVHTFDRRRGDNPNLKFPQRREINIGLEGSLYKNLINFTASAFFNQTRGNVVQPGVLYPSYLTTGFPVYSDIPYVNYDNDQRRGFDFGIRVNKKTGEIDWSLGVTGTYYDTKATKRAESYQFDYLNRAGKPLDALWGLQSLGFFSSTADIAASPAQSFGQVKPGDLKYKDQNGDGIIDTRDEVYLGKGGWLGAPMTLGVNLTAKWKNLSLFVLGTGRYGAKAMKNSNYFWVDGEDKYSIVVRDRWTPETQATATYPRLTTASSDNNFRSSDFWLYSTNRFDLSKVQLSYQFPANLFRNGFVRELGIYASGMNLLTIAPEREILELNVNTSPQTRFYNLGVKALF